MKRPARTFVLFIFLALFPALILFGDESPEWKVIFEKMEKAYAAVNDYRAEVEVRTYGKDGSSETERFLYTFRKPGSIRLDFESPHGGMILIYPDKKGKVAVRPPGIAHFMKLHLAPGNPLITVSSGQPIDKTDLGSLIEHIGRSLTDERQGPVDEWSEAGNVNIRVPGLNHFRNHAPTLYEFSIDTRLWLPVAVKEMTPEGVLQRIVTFHNLEVNKNIPENLFRLDGEEEASQEGKGRK